MFNGVNDKDGSPDKNDSELEDLKQVNQSLCCNKRSGTLRSIWYLLGLVLLISITTLNFFSLFTNHWIVTASKLINDNDVYFLQGVFFRCRATRISWIPEQTDKYCMGVNNDSNGWIISVQVFYTIGSFLNLTALCFAMLGLCMNIAKKQQAISSLVMWVLIVSSLFQLIAISVYAGETLSNYEMYEPDYSIITASVALGTSVFCAIFFMLDLFKYRDKTGST